MSGYLTNTRPAASTNWGIGNSQFVTRFIEPSVSKKQAGWADLEAPPAVIFNWMFNNYHVWIKNLDERTPKTAVYNWTVNNATDRATDRDFISLVDAIADTGVANGDTILVQGTPALSALLTISKSLTIVFASGASLYGAPGNGAVKISLNAPGIKIVGGSFYSFAGEVFNLTANAENCSISGSYFENIATPIVDTNAPPGAMPAVTGCTHYQF